MMPGLRFALALLAPRRGALVAGALVALLSVALGLGVLLAAGAAIAGGAAAASLPLLRLFAPLRVAVRYAERLATHAALFRVLADIRVWLFARLAAAGPIALGRLRAGDLLNRMLSDIDALDALYLRVLVPVGLAMLGAGALLLFVLWLDPALAMVPLLLLLVVAVGLPLVLARRQARIGAEVGERLSALRVDAVDAAEGMREILGAGAEARMAARLAASTKALATAQGKAARQNALAGALAGGAVQAGLVAFLLLGAERIAAGALEPAMMALGLFAILALAELLAALPRAGLALGQAAGAGARLAAIAATPAPYPDPAREAAAPAPQGFALEIEGLLARYGADRPLVLDGLCLSIPEGARVAILGESGAGKSTLAALLMRMIPPAAGRIRLGGVDLAAMTGAALRARIAYVAQDSALFSATIRENLLIGSPEADEAALWRALDAAQLGDFVRGLPDGLETWCGEGGVRLSGGQARRVLLARALLRAAPILLLDEPTAGLDPDTARAFMAALNGAAAGRSVILITHRLTGAEALTMCVRIAGGRAEIVTPPSPPAAGGSPS
ncbi:MAG: thiol reductant ABC exporter subunit CydC [Alphaproteobacteria bacterium]|nr:thiol reductant ABC exporter subunit CydC [Alphaproteobacteria bacterium]